MENKELLYSRLDTLCDDLKDKNLNFNNVKKEVENLKTELKEIFDKLNISEYEGKNSKIHITEIDNSYLDEIRTIEYLKKNGLDKYIKVKEYIDPNELIVASQKGELKVEDLAPFRIEKFEKRVIIK